VIGQLPGVLLAMVIDVLSIEFNPLAGVVHRDIKVDNCLISELGIAKIGDFGLAHILPSPNSSDQLFKGMGSRKYRAPEVVQDRSGTTGFSGFRADVCLLVATEPFGMHSE
jgi:serine/threonine protein kinase